MSENTWSKYIERTKDNPPRADLVKALEFVKNKGKALDLGSGALVDAKYLAEQGFGHVVAVDQAKASQEIYETLPKDTVEYVISSFEDYDFPQDEYDLINAQFSLPFNPPATFDSVFKRIKSALKKNGIFVGQLFGELDEWNKSDSKMTFHTREEAEKLLNNLEVLFFKEVEEDKASVLGGTKHWHIFHIIARKK